jgi:hypothetical protein
MRRAARPEGFERAVSFVPEVQSATGAFSGPFYAVQLTFKGPDIEENPPRQLTGFPVLNLPHSGGSYHTYAVDPKGGRVLIMQFAQVASAATTPTTQIGPDTPSGLTIALNWLAGLKK